MATKYATNATNEARRNVTGTTTVHRQYVASGETFSTGDIIEFMRLPHGAKVVDWYIKGRVPATTLHCSIGLDGSGTDSNFFATSLTASSDLADTMLRSDDLNAAWAPKMVSVSDEAVMDYRTVTISVTAGGTATTTGTIDLVMTYSLDAA